MSEIKKLGPITAYAIACEHGFTGTEAEWLASLRPNDLELYNKIQQYFADNPYLPIENGTVTVQKLGNDVKDVLARKVDRSEIDTIYADDELLNYSTRPVQNRIVTGAINQLQAKDVLLTQAVQNIEQRQTSPYNFKGAVATLADLPSTGQEVNDTYYVEAIKYRVTWTGSAWQQSSMEESQYADELADLKNDLAEGDKNFGVYSAVKTVNGYIKNDGTSGSPNSQYSKVTDYIPCAEGDAFEYTGAYSAVAVSALFYDASKVIVGNAHSSTITVPSGASFVRFFSYAMNGTEATLQVIADKGIIPEIQSGFSDLKNANLEDSKNLGIYSAITTVPGYIKNDGTSGSPVSQYSKVTDYIPCAEGDTFEYTGAYSALAVSALFYDASKVIVGNAHSSIVTIPADVSFVRFFSYAMVSDEPELFVVKKDGFVAPLLDDFTAKVENHLALKKWIPYSIGAAYYNTDGVGHRYHGDSTYPRLSLLWMSDMHFNLFDTDRNVQNVKDAYDLANNTLAYIDTQGKDISVKAVINCGDVLQNQTSVSGSKPTLKKLFDIAKNSTIPTLFAKGNHDNYALADEDWGEVWLDYAESEFGIVRQTKQSGKKSTWHYLDLPDYKVRIIVADAQDVDRTALNPDDTMVYNGETAWAISNEQLNWFATTALNFDDKAEKDWGVIVAIHQGIKYSTLLENPYESSIKKLADLCAAFNTQSTYSNHYTYAPDSFYNIDIDADFTRYVPQPNQWPPHMICWLLGHEHYDRHEVYNGIHMITIANMACMNTSSDRSLERIPGTPTQNLFDLITIDRRDRKMRIIRCGAGENAYGDGGNRFLPDGLEYYPPVNAN